MVPARRPHVRFRSYLLVFAILAAILLLAHGPLLQLPFYWDEIGQFVPASLDLYQSSAWIPRTTLPNIHPPGLMAYLAVVWTLCGYSIEATRVAMLLIAAAAALGAFLLAIELGQGTVGVPAFPSVLMLCVSPLFFSQSMMVLLDMPAMCLTTFALLAFLQNRLRTAAALCIVLVLVKETGIVAAAVFGCWLLYERRWRDALWFALPIPALGVWIFALHQATGSWFGNAEFSRYNVWYPLHPVRLAFSLVRRFYYLFLSTGHVIGTIVLVYAWRRVAVFKDRSWRVAFLFAAMHVAAMCLLGGAVLERYLLPVMPILYAAFAISFNTLGPGKRIASTAVFLLLLCGANFVFPPYPFPFENNLAWTSFVGLEQRVASNLNASPLAMVATAFPLSDALRRQEFGFVGRDRQVTQVNSFRLSDLKKLQALPPDKLVVFTQTWDPFHLIQGAALGGFLERYYGYEPEATTAEIEQLWGMRVEHRWQSRGLEFTLLTRR